MENFLIFFSIFFFFYLGAIFGSFLNVLSFEIEKFFFSEKNFFQKIKNLWKKRGRRSSCQNCKKILETKDLFPIFSFIFLKRKCAHCKEKISWRYFLVEIFSAFIFLGLFFKISNFSPFLVAEFFSFSSFLWEYIFFIPILSSLILISLFDLKHKIIPDIILLPAFFYTLFFINFDFQNFAFDFSYFFDDIFRAFAFAFPFFAIWFFSSGKAMGFADWKLIFLLSLFLENSLQNLLFVFGAFWIGAIYSIPLLFSKKKSLKSQIPFGPFIILSFFLVYFFNLSYFTFLEIF